MHRLFEFDTDNVLPFFNGYYDTVLYKLRKRPFATERALILSFNLLFSPTLSTFKNMRRVPAFKTLNQERVTTVIQYCMKRRSSNKKFRRFKVFLFIFCMLVIGVLVYFQQNVTRVLISISEATIRSITTVAVNDAIYYTLNDTMRYEDLIYIERDDAGNVTSITTDSLKINRIARDTAYLSQENLNKMSAEGIMVPMGALTGVEALAGFGSKINIKIIPISNVECRFVSKFTDAGINQTKHSLYLEIVSDISIILPSKSTNLASTIEVLICESVIAGKIPDTYLQATLIGSNGALVPDKKP